MTWRSGPTADQLRGRWGTKKASLTGTDRYRPHYVRVFIAYPRFELLIWDSSSPGAFGGLQKTSLESCATDVERPASE